MQKTITLPQGTIEYEDEGNPAGAPVVFVHGFLADGDLWASTSRALGDRVRVLRPTWPTGSHRIPVDVTPTPREIAGIIVAFLDALGLDDPVLVANDSGGAIVQFLMEAAPDRVRRVVFTNCDCFEKFPPFPFSMMLPAARVPGGLETALAGLRLRSLRDRLIFGLLTTEPHPELFARFAAPYLGDRAIRRQARELVRGVDPGDLLRVTTGLGSWDGDALLVWGMRDRFFTPALGRRLASVLGAEMIEIADAKTFLPLDAPAQLADAVARFATAERGQTPSRAGSQASGSAPARMEAGSGSR